jgi:hypothetical protein
MAITQDLSGPGLRPFSARNPRRPGRLRRRWGPVHALVGFVQGFADHLGQNGPMTQISERYRRNAEAFAAVVSAVPADRWADPSPPAPGADKQARLLAFLGRRPN